MFYSRLIDCSVTIEPMHSGDVSRDTYDQLRIIAEHVFRSQGRDHTLQPTALINEAWLKIANGGSWNDRGHFIAVAARAMRQVLVDHARAQRTEKRGGAWKRVTLSGQTGEDGTDVFDALALHEALESLSSVDPRQSRIVELRFFGGLSTSEIASILDISRRTVDLDLKMARAWLARRLDGLAVSNVQQAHE